MTDTSFNEDQTTAGESASVFEPPPGSAGGTGPTTTPRFDVGSFFAGLLFLGLGVAFVLEAADQWTFEFSDFRFIGPLVLIVIGLATLVGAGAGQQSDRT